MMRLATVSLTLLVFSGAALAQSADKPTVKDGWVEKAFDFSAPDLDFTTLVPEGAKADTVPMKMRQPEVLGRITIVGEVLPPPDAKVPIRWTVLGYDLRTSGAADRICDWVLKSENYRKVEEHISRHRSAASTIGLKYEGDVAVQGIVSRCLTRGRQAINVNLLFDLPKKKTDEERDAILDVAIEYAQTVFGNMAFRNGQSDGYWDGVKEIPITIDGKMLDVRIPDDWQVPINDFDGRPTAELHMLKEEKGAARGGVWLLASDMKKKPDLAEAGGKMIPFFLKLQFQAKDAPKLEDDRAGPDLNDKGASLHHFLFSVKDDKGEDGGEIHAIMIWNDGRLYTVIRWVPFIQDGSANAFFSTLPSLTIYDAFGAAVHGLVSEKD